jgi:hypothetical protein
MAGSNRLTGRYASIAAAVAEPLTLELEQLMFDPDQDFPAL